MLCVPTLKDPTFVAVFEVTKATAGHVQVDSTVNL